MPQFTDENIAKLFGAEAAEDEPEERFRQYFVFNKTYESLVSNLPLRILVGHKGVGKSALLKRARLNDEDRGTLSVWLTPGDISQHSESSDNAEFSAVIESWKRGVITLISKKILGDAAQEFSSKTKLGRLGKSISSFIPDLINKISNSDSLITNSINKTIIENFKSTGIINIYIDDIDRGWSASPSDIRNISALLNAMRDISREDNRIRFRIGLRSDVYFLVRTSDESTDKFESNVIWLSWSNHEILCIIAKRIETFFGIDREQAEIFKLSQTNITNSVLSRVIEPVFSGQGHWSSRPMHNVLLSLTRQRPRDLVKLMHGAAKKAAISDHSTISSRDLESAFEEYSYERLQDIINEFRGELPDIERLLLGMRPTKREITTSRSYLFSNDQLIGKINNIMGQVNLRFTNNRPVTAKSLIQFLYKIDFVTARKKQVDGTIERKYFDRSRFLASEFADFGFEWEIHPAYRWALQPQNIQDVIDSLGR